MTQETGPLFRLVLERQTSPSATSNHRLHDLLEKEFGLGSVFEIDELLSSGPITIKRTSNQAEAIQCLDILTLAGAKVTLEEISAPTTAILPIDADTPSLFGAFFNDYSQGLMSVLSSVNIADVELFIDELLDARAKNRQIFVFGNGGSAAAASHFATDLLKVRFPDRRSLFRVLCLNESASWMTATANDFGYENVFANQLQSLLQPDDMVIAVSSSGNSANIINAIETANSLGGNTWGISGFDGGNLLSAAKRSIHVPTKRGQYGFAEDASGILFHMISIFLYQRDKDIFE
jgi:D-sedoheptulose 7-phosphate isomerase